MMEIQGNASIRPQSQVNTIQEQGERGNVTQTLRNARSGHSIGHLIGRIVLGVFTLGISEGIRAIIKSARAATPNETPPARINQRQESANLSGTNSSSRTEGPNLMDALNDRSFENAINDSLSLLKAGVPADEIIANLRGSPNTSSFVDEVRVALSGSHQLANPVSQAQSRDSVGNSQVNLQNVINDSRTALNAGVPLEDILANLRNSPNTSSYVDDIRYALVGNHSNSQVNSAQSNARHARLVSQEEALARAENVPRHAVGEGADRRIASHQDLVNFIKDMAFSQPGQSQHIGSGQASDGTSANLYHYNGFAFRADARSPENIRASSGMHSRQDLSIEKNRQESQGLDFNSGPGATGQSGISMAKDLDGAAAYYTGGGIYIIDTKQLGEGQSAYDLQKIIDSTDRQVDTGKEVNATDVPEHAIVGWISLPPDLCDDVADAADNTVKIGKIISYIEQNPQYVGLNPSYRPAARTNS